MDDEADWKKKAAIGELNTHHSTFVLDREFLKSSGAYYQKDKLQFLIDKSLVQRDEE